MTLAPDDLRGNQLELLTRLLDETADQDIGFVIFKPDDPRFADIYPTSWVRLTEADYLEAKRLFGTPQYRFTPHGWVHALELTGRLASRAIAERAQRLLRAIKARVERSAHIPALLDVDALVTETEIPMGWLHNALASNLLDALYPERGYSVEHKGIRTFRAPTTFGHPPSTYL